MNNNTKIEAVEPPSNCICIGMGAHVIKDYMFCFTVPIKASTVVTSYQTEMTPEEFKVVNRVVRRAIGQKLMDITQAIKI